jgi:hypothetical protein
MSEVSAQVARDLAEQLVIAEERIRYLEANEQSYVNKATLDDATIHALREQVAALTKQPTYGANHCKSHDGYGFTSDCVVCNERLQEQDK